MNVLREYIRNLVIKEVGEGTTSYPFEFKEDQPAFGQKEGGPPMAGYKINADIPVVVSVTPMGDMDNESGIRVDFYSVKVGSSGEKFLSGEPTNVGIKSMFRVMTTIKEIIKDYLKRYNWEVDFIGYAASAEKIGGSFSGEKAQQRNKLYIAYIKKLFPNASVNSRQADETDDIVSTISFNKRISYKDV